MKKLLQHTRLRLASVDAILLLALLGLLSGILAGGIILSFRYVIESSQSSFMSHVENYEALSWQWQLGLPLCGGIIIGLALHFIQRRDRIIGVVHVMERLNYHEGHLPLRNALVQFFGGAISIISGHSVGREGPSVHLGASASSLLGQWLQLPNNSIRTLVACGCAAAIAGSFNTPLAGVIFAMEVIMMEYTISGFIPVILAAVSATVLSRAVYGAEAAFLVPNFDLASLLEMPWIVFMGVIIGALAASFNGLLQYLSEWRTQSSILLRCSGAGLITGIIALAYPEVMGIGYDTVTAAMLGELGIVLLVGILCAKLIATAIGLGLGLPGGLIAPSLFIGAAAGGVVGLIGAQLFPDNTASVGLYVMIGMAAMMAATLQAPMAALMALLELTGNPNIILPGMLAVIAATLTTSEVFKRPSIFITLLRSRGLDYRHNPLEQNQRRIGITSLMTTSFVRFGQHISHQQAAEVLTTAPQWIIVENDNGPVALLPTPDLQRYIEQTATTADRPSEAINLLAIPGQRLQLAGLHCQATAQQAVKTLAETQAEALYIWRPSAPQILRIEGIVTRDTLAQATGGI